mmetsp:Transcript_17817/g.49336  ORF Transcript_17817/g.49336 Transcript_17817/m.49336 type:complete len:328 (-) Transcript_17817:776-1759(-)
MRRHAHWRRPPHGRRPQRRRKEARPVRRRAGDQPGDRGARRANVGAGFLLGTESGGDSAQDCRRRCHGDRDDPPAAAAGGPGDRQSAAAAGRPDLVPGAHGGAAAGGFCFERVSETRGLQHCGLDSGSRPNQHDRGPGSQGILRRRAESQKTQTEIDPTAGQNRRKQCKEGKQEPRGILHPDAALVRSGNQEIGPGQNVLCGENRKHHGLWTLVRNDILRGGRRLVFAVSGGHGVLWRHCQPADFYHVWGRPILPHGISPGSTRLFERVLHQPLLGPSLLFGKIHARVLHGLPTGRGTARRGVFPHGIPDELFPLFGAQLRVGTGQH